MKEIHKELGKIAERNIEREIREIEEARDDSNRMYKAVKNIRRMKGKEPVVIQHEGGITTDEGKQTEIIFEFFKNMFNDNNAREIGRISPAKISFKKEEIKRAVKSLKNNRNPGIDDITAEHLKNGPDIVYDKIAELLNHSAATGDFPMELNCGILIPLQ